MRENGGPLLNELGDLQKADVLSAAFTLVFTSKTSLQESHALETRGRVRSKDQVREYQAYIKG